MSHDVNLRARSRESWRDTLPDELDDEAGSRIHRALAVMNRPTDVVELRAFKGRWTRSGYFDDHNILADEAVKLDRQGWQLYTTLNEVDPALLARAANRVREVGARDPLTSDKDVTRRRWLLVDLDPVRPSDVSATEDEKQAAYLRAKDLLSHLRALGWPAPVIADSGNGFHLLYPVDLPNAQDNHELVKGALGGLAFMFDDGRVKVDTSVHNAARIVRLYGTTTRKGDHLPERPHRRSEVLKVPKEVR